MFEDLKFILEEELDLDSPLTGLSLWVNSEKENVWIKLAEKLSTRLEGINLHQFLLKASTLTPPHDLSPVFALPFFQTLQTMAIGVDLTPNAKEALFSVIENSQVLKTLSFMNLELMNTELIKLVSILPSTVNVLDLGHTLIRRDGTNLKSFFERLISSNVNHLILDCIDDEEVSSLVFSPDKPLHVQLEYNPGLTEAGLQLILAIVKQTPNLKLEIGKLVNPLKRTDIFKEINAIYESRCQVSAVLQETPAPILYSAQSSQQAELALADGSTLVEKIRRLTI